MLTLHEAADEFLAQKRIAVVGVSRQPNEAANNIYRKLRESGYEVFAVNPQADEVEGDRCYHALNELPLVPDGIVVATPPQATERVVQDAGRLGIKRVWMHRSFGEGSTSEAAVAYCREHGMRVIPAGCPMMFCEPVDIAHKCMRWFLGATNKLPKAV